MMRLSFLSLFIAIVTVAHVFAEQMAPGLTLSDDQLRQKMDSRWQPVRQFVLTDNHKKMMYDRFATLVEQLEKEEKKQYVFSSIKGGSISGATMTGNALSGGIISGTVFSGAALSGQSLSGAALSGTQFLGAAVSGDMISGSMFSGSMLSGTLSSGGVVVYRYVPRYRVCDSLLALDEAVGAMVYTVRRDIIGSSNPKMKQTLMAKGEVLAFLHTMIKEYAEENKLFVTKISEGGAAAREYRVCK